MTSLAETYRPRRFEDVVGQDDAVRKLTRLRDAGRLSGKAYFIRGLSGTGKSAIAELIASEVADPLGIEKVVGRSLTAAAVEELHKGLRFRGMGKPGRAVVIEEAHGMSLPTVEALLFATDPMNIQPHAVWIMTTTLDGGQLFDTKADAGPLLSRCVELTLRRDGLEEPFAGRLLEIARAEDLDGQPLSAYRDLVRRCRGNMREALMRIECGEMCCASASPSEVPAEQRGRSLLIGRR